MLYTVAAHLLLLPLLLCLSSGQITAWQLLRISHQAHCCDLLHTVQLCPQHMLLATCQQTKHKQLSTSFF
jgi:hypothetical protein